MHLFPLMGPHTLFFRSHFVLPKASFAKQNINYSASIYWKELKVKTKMIQLFGPQGEPTVLGKLIEI